MKPEDIPAELVTMLDDAAGKQHSRTGAVLTALAAILTRHDENRAQYRIDDVIDLPPEPSTGTTVEAIEQEPARIVQLHREPGGWRLYYTDPRHLASGRLHPWKIIAERYFPLTVINLRPEPPAESADKRPTA